MANMGYSASNCCYMKMLVVKIVKIKLKGIEYIDE